MRHLTTITPNWRKTNLWDRGQGQRGIAGEVRGPKGRGYFYNAYVRLVLQCEEEMES